MYNWRLIKVKRLLNLREMSTKWKQKENREIYRREIPSIFIEEKKKDEKELEEHGERIKRWMEEEEIEKKMWNP